MSRCHSAVYVLLVCSLCSTVAAENSTSSCSSKNRTLTFLVLAPSILVNGSVPESEIGGLVIPATLTAVKEINARCDILGDYKIEIQSAESGCDISSTATASLAEHAFAKPDDHVVGVIGPYCSKAAIEIGDVLSHERIELLHLSPSATSPKLLDQERFPNTVRVVGSSRDFVTVYLALIKELQFKKVAILFDHVNIVYSEAAVAFEKQILMKFNHSVIVASYSISENVIPLEEIENRFRIVFVFGGKEISRKVLCVAFHRDLLYPNYQYYFSELALVDFLTDVTVSLSGSMLNCSHDEDIQKAIVGNVLGSFVSNRRDTESILVNGATYNDFYWNYLYTLYEYVNENGQYYYYNNNSFFPAQDLEHYQSTFYDSVWALALALNSSIPRLDSELGASLDDYAYGNNDMTAVIRSELLKVTFEGASGFIDLSVHINVNIALYAALGHEMIIDNVTMNFVRHLPGILYNGTAEIINESYFIPSEFDQKVGGPNIYVEAAVLCVVAIVAVVLLFFQVVNIKWVAMKSMKVTSPALNHLIFSGCYVYLVSILFLSFDQYIGSAYSVLFGVKCSGFVWCETLSFTLIFGTVCIKSWRILRIFSNSSAKMLNNLSSHRLTGYVCIILLLDFVYLILWNSINPWFQEIIAEDERHVRFVCNCENLSAWVSMLLFQKALLTGVVFYLSLATNRVSKQEYKQTITTNILIYVYIFTNSILLPVYILLVSTKNTDTLTITIAYLAICLKNIVCVIMCIVLIFLPPIIPILDEKWIRKGESLMFLDMVINVILIIHIASPTTPLFSETNYSLKK